MEDEQQPKASGIETPTREDLVRLDRKREKRTSNKEWMSPADGDARIAKMKDGSTHLARKSGVPTDRSSSVGWKAEHAVDMESGAIIAVTLQTADLGDTTTVHLTLATAGLAVAELVVREVELHPEEEPKVSVDGVEELVADKGYHSGAVLEQVKALEVTTYIPKKKQAGKRNWDGKESEQQAVEENQSRVSGEYGKELLRKRGELVERSIAHCYETGGMRRCTLRGHENILKRLLIHIGAFNISLILRTMLGAGKPRELKNRAARLVLRLFEWLTGRYRSDGAVESRTASILTLPGANRSGKPQYWSAWNSATFTTGC